MKKILYKIGVLLSVVPVATLTSSCDDWFSIMPQSEMVADDFWRDEQDVQSAVGACYRAMEEDGFMRRLLVWGELRSDNVIKGFTTDTDIDRIQEANITSANSYAKWGDFYTVINYCNTVIKNAPAVRERDVDFTESDLNHLLAEVKTIRAFCYFTLVRTFNNVPYIEEPYVDDTRAFTVAQTPCEAVLDTLIRDLKSVENLAVTDYNDRIAYTRGRVTQKAVWALIADMYLWKNDYDNCVAYCDKVLKATTNPLALVPSASYFNSVFTRGNSDESIWELQFDTNTRNSALSSFYGNASSLGLLSALDFESLSGDEFWGTLDMRRIGAYAQNGKNAIMKYVAFTYNTDYKKLSFRDFVYGSEDGHWIIYRLADIYLMKAEALAEMELFSEAVDMVSFTYDRARPEQEEGSLKGLYNSLSEVRNLVFDERQREFLFEGKRYFDIVRRIRREGNTINIVSNYLLRKYVAMSLDENTIKSKVNDPDAIYMPIHEDELRMNTLLEQNRFYKTFDNISKN